MPKAKATKTTSRTDQATIRLMLYDSTRKPFSQKQSLLVRVHNGQSIDPITKTVNLKSGNDGVVFLKVNYFDNFADNYSVLVSAEGYKDVGFFPIHVSPRVLADISLMLIPENPVLQFDPWELIVGNHPAISKFLSLTPADQSAKDKYEDSFEDHPRETACLLNLATAMSQIFLRNGTPLEYFRSIEWGTLARDRFFGYAVPELVSEVKAAVPNLFAPEFDPGAFHSNATCSFKEIRFGEANVQLTFHENDQRAIGGAACVRVEPDMDYYKDFAAHALLEVVYNLITNSLTDPSQVYLLRWIAGKQLNQPEFDPPYRIVAA